MPIFSFFITPTLFPGIYPQEIFSQNPRNICDYNLAPYMYGGSIETDGRR